MNTVLLAFKRWAVCWRNSLVHIYTDSNVTLYSLTKGRMSNSVGMNIVREIHDIMAFYNVTVKFKRISTKANIFADALSRMDNPVFAEKALVMLMSHNLHSCKMLCNPLSHMSVHSWLFLLQSWGGRRHY